VTTNFALPVSVGLWVFVGLAVAVAVVVAGVLSMRR
jgi:hypothetical protein